LARNLSCGNGPIASSYRDFNATSKNATWIYLVISNSGACLYRYCYTLFIWCSQKQIIKPKIETLYSNKFNIANAIKTADLVVSTVLIPGAKAPKLVTKEMVKDMPDGGVIVDVAIDQGGTTEYTEGRPTSHDNPIFVEEGVLHYSVANIPGAVAQTSTYALCNATAKYVKLIAKLGVKEAVAKFPELVPGVNVANGKVTFKAVADDLGYEYTPVEQAL